MLQRQSVNVNDLVDGMAEKLKESSQIKAPAWGSYVKTGAHKQRPPADSEWWHKRAAAVLRQVARLGPIGVAKLTVKYGGKKNRGHKPEHFYAGSGSIARKVLQQLEEAGLVKKEEKSVHKGRIITAKGLAIIRQVSKSLKPAAEAQKPKPAKAKPESNE